jgi:hypothetical protein
VRRPAHPLRLDRLIRAGAIHSMTGELYRSVGLRGSEIIAVATEADGPDDLIGARTAMVDATSPLPRSVLGPSVSWELGLLRARHT